MSKEQIYENAKRKSVNNNLVKANVANKKIKRAFITGAILSALAVGVTVLGINLVSDKVEFNKALEPYSEVVMQNTHVTNDGKGVWYDNLDIARDLSSDGEVSEVDIYGVYSAMQFNKQENMDEVISNSLGIEEKSFDEYLIAKGFVKDGKADKSTYERVMQELLVAQAKRDAVTLEGEKSSGPRM